MKTTILGAMALYMFFHTALNDPVLANILAIIGSAVLGLVYGAIDVMHGESPP